MDITRALCAVGLVLPIMDARIVQAAGPIDLMSHMALYRLEMVDDGRASAFESVDGALGIEWRDGCEGSTSQQHLYFIGDVGEGDAVTMDVRFASFEAADGQMMRFSVRSFDGDDLFEEFKGTANRDDQTIGEAAFSEPKGLVMELPAGTLFPTAHIRSLIGAARDGSPLVTHEVFDGSGPNALSHVTAIIGPANDDAGDDDRAAAGRWPVSLAYFDDVAADTTPQFEIRFDLGEDGVLHDITLDYGDFALSARLERLETLDKPDCG